MQNYRYLPRLFTGAMLPEDLCTALGETRKLHCVRSEECVAASVSLEDSLWVPTSVLETQQLGQRVAMRSGVRPFHIGTQCPSALQLFARHCGSVGGSLVSASQTTSPATLVAFFQSLQEQSLGGAVPRPGDQNNSSSDGTAAAGSSDALPYLPLTLSGGFFPAQVAKALVEHAVAHSLHSPYWLPEEGRAIRRPVFAVRDPTAGVTIAGKRYVNAEHTTCPGFFTPDNLPGAYEPYSIYGTMFSTKDERLMHRRALQYRYSRALWLTEEEGERFGCFLRDECRRDEGPLRLCVPFQGGRRLLYCADQFDRPERLPTRREIHALASGAAEPAAKRNAYPALQEVHRSAAGREEFVEFYANRFSPLVSSKTETRRNRFVYAAYLRGFAALAGIREEVFMTSNNLYRFGDTFRVRDGAVCAAKHGGFRNIKDVTLFSARDVEPHGVAVQLVANAPTSVDSLRRYFGMDAISMCRYQAERQALMDATTGGTLPSKLMSTALQRKELVNHWWITSALLDALGLLPLVDLSKTFHVVRQVVPLTRTGSKTMTMHAPSQTTCGADDEEAPAAAADVAVGIVDGHHSEASTPTTETRIYVYVADVPDPDGRLSALMKYFPVNWIDVEFTGAHRSAMLRAAARDRSLLRDPRWLSLRFLSQHGIFDVSTRMPAAAITVNAASDESDDAVLDDGCQRSSDDGWEASDSGKARRFGDASAAAVGGQFTLMSMRLVPVASLSKDQRARVDAALVEAKKTVEIRDSKNEFSFDTRGSLRKSFRQSGPQPLSRAWTPEVTAQLAQLYAVPADSTAW